MTMKKIITRFILSTLFFANFLFAQQSYSPNFVLNVRNKNSERIIRTGSFLPTLVEPTKKNIDPMDPGSSGHLSVLLTDRLSIVGKNDSLEKKLNTPGS